MKEKIMKNLKYILRISGIGYRGEGVGRIDGFTFFIPGALQGEKVIVKAVKVNKNFAFGKLLDVVEPSPERVNPPCAVYKRCGGCQLQHMSYSAQLNFKKNRVRECLERIGKFEVTESSGENSLKLYDTLGMKNPYRYRNKVQLPVGRDESGLKIGFYANRSHDIIDMDSCLIQDESADRVVKSIRKWIEKYNVPVYDEKTGRGIIRHIMIRKAFVTGEIMVVIVTSVSEIPHKAEFIEALIQNIPHIVSIIQNINDRRTNVILGDKSVTLWGKDSISDYIGKFRFNISPMSFFQVNPLQTKILYRKVLEYAHLTGNEIVFDAYCGTGTISLFLSQKAKKVYGIEIVESAVENAGVNARENGIHNVKFISGKSEEIIPKLAEEGIKADVMVVDPPRKGCDAALLRFAASMSPRTIVYVSCDPATLARDLGILSNLGYRPEKVQPVDMFPQTAHVETVVKLKRKDS
ncbi:23S rRNA (uracil(1939)-C(5))-methyltransferase RlmD [uncultured Clostridium sp.]|uniref:23S rRNA (uracil(1939)-C(5))-methyltransferase RlmD n=1 Tax=uncultured Clostridium sp. TaxID=59620 RepID=UPI0025E3B736|nr:23S rRNA (uracil(1939)-C(5))-methyltransferase RlmD [uncultured Clostridium sp.]